MSSVVPDVATATPVAIGDAGAAAEVAAAAAAAAAATAALTSCCCCWGCDWGCCCSSCVTLPMRVTDGSRFGGTTGLLGGIGGGTPRPRPGSAAGVFLIVEMFDWCCCWWWCVLIIRSLPACWGCCMAATGCEWCAPLAVIEAPAAAAHAIELALAPGPVGGAATLESLRGATCGCECGEHTNTHTHARLRTICG